MMIIIFHKKRKMTFNSICFYQTTYSRYSAQVALREAASGNYLGILLSNQTVKKMEKSVFVYADAMLALGPKLKEISDSIEESVTKFLADKENFGPKFRTIYKNIFHERGKTQYRVEMVAKGNMPPMFGVAQFYIPEGDFRWAPTKFSVFMPKYIWDRLYEAVPEIISGLSGVMSARKGVRSFIYCALL